MADLLTTNFDFILPEIGGSNDTWGEKLHENWIKADELFTAWLQTERVLKTEEVIDVNSYSTTLTTAYGANGPLGVYVPLRTVSYVKVDFFARADVSSDVVDDMELLGRLRWYNDSVYVDFGSYDPSFTQFRVTNIAATSPDSKWTLRCSLLTTPAHRRPSNGQLYLRLHFAGAYAGTKSINGNAYYRFTEYLPAGVA